MSRLEPLNLRRSTTLTAYSALVPSFRALQTLLLYPAPTSLFLKQVYAPTLHSLWSSNSLGEASLVCEPTQRSLGCYLCWSESRVLKLSGERQRTRILVKLLYDSAMRLKQQTYLHSQIYVGEKFFEVWHQPKNQMCNANILHIIISCSYMIQSTTPLLDLQDLSCSYEFAPGQQFNDEMMSYSYECEDSTPKAPSTNFDILLNKAYNNGEITDVELQQLSEQERNILAAIQNKPKAKKKRTDQCQKLFFKKAFKFSQRKFHQKAKQKNKRMNCFYHHHFDEVCARELVPITMFYHPNKKTKPGLQLGFKTFNAKYISLLLKSKSFLVDVREYHQIFRQECSKERQRKLNSFSNSIRRIMQRSQDDPRILMSYLESSKCKIPWTDEEINDTWELAGKELQERVATDADTQKQKEQLESAIASSGQTL